MPLVDVMAGWKWIVGVIVAAACQHAPADEDVADASDAGPGSESGDTGDAPAMKSCWRWDRPANLDGLSYVAALSGGDLVVGGNSVIVRMSPDGDVVWTLNPQNVQMQEAVPLPDDGFAVMGTWQQYPWPGFLRAYDGDGLATWQTSQTDTPLYSAAYWSVERELLFVLGGTNPNYHVDAFDLDGTLVESLPLDNGSGANVGVHSIAPLADGFVVTGGILEDDDVRSYVAAYDVAGLRAWVRDDANGYIDDLATLDANRIVTAASNADDVFVSMADATGAVEWSWHDGRPGRPALAVADDGRIYVSITVFTTGDDEIDRLVELSAEGTLLSIVEADDADAQWFDAAWANGRVFTVGTAATDSGSVSRVECWDPSGD
jgi:hypothetical protein